MLLASVSLSGHPANGVIPTSAPLLDTVGRATASALGGVADGRRERPDHQQRLGQSTWAVTMTPDRPFTWTATMDNAVRRRHSDHMGRWPVEWSGGWRDEQFIITSPMSVEQALRRLNERLDVRQKRTLGDWSRSDIQVRGRVDSRSREIVLRASRAGQRNSFRPVLRGQLRPAGAGCQLRCRLGWHPFVRVFSLVWLGGVLLLLLAGLVEAAYPLALASVLFLLFFVGLVAVAGMAARGEVDYLNTWLRESVSESSTPTALP